MLPDPAFIVDFSRDLPPDFQINGATLGATLPFARDSVELTIMILPQRVCSLDCFWLVVTDSIVVVCYMHAPNQMLSIEYTLFLCFFKLHLKARKDPIYLLIYIPSTGIRRIDFFLFKVTWGYWGWQAIELYHWYLFSNWTFLNIIF